MHCAKLAEDIADLLAPQSGAYYDIWLDGEKFVSAQMEVSGRSPLRPRLCSPPALPGLKTMPHCGHRCAECAAVQEAVIGRLSLLLALGFASREAQFFWSGVTAACHDCCVRTGT